MRVELHAGARQFLAAANSLLRSDPLSTNVIAVVAGRIATGAEPDNDRYLWATVGDGKGRVLGAAMHRPPHHLFVSRMSAEAAASLAHALADAVLLSGQILVRGTGARSFHRPPGSARKNLRISKSMAKGRSAQDLPGTAPRGSVNKPSCRCRQRILASA